LTQTSQDRRSFIATLASGLLAAPLAAEVQQAVKGGLTRALVGFDFALGFARRGHNRAI
jgi:hypothetical protein